MDENGNCLTADEALEMHLLEQIRVNQQLAQKGNMRSVTDVTTLLQKSYRVARLHLTSHMYKEAQVP